MKRFSILLQISVILAVIFGIAILPACNAKNDSEDDTTSGYGTVAVTAFSLTADIRVMNNLDSVFFSIDLDHGVIFNADSLPKGTNVTKLIPKISYPSSVATAVIEMTGGNHRTGTANYHTNPSDTIDFTGKVTLTLTSADGSLSKKYDLKVNVHQEDPDTLYWEQMASSPLPSRMAQPKAQKTVSSDDKTYCIIEEANREFTLAVCNDLFAADWNKSEITFGFTPQLQSLYALGGNFYVLASDGELYSSADGQDWTSTGMMWQAIIGDYNGVLMGIRLNSGEYVSTFLSDSPDATEVPLPDNFPVKGFSAPISYTSPWLSSPLLMITGGETIAHGALTGATWAFDGSAWAMISDTPLPPVNSPIVCKYYSYLKASNGKSREFDVMLAFGGKLSDGTINDITYISYNQGISWQQAPSYAQLPDFMPSLYAADIMCSNQTLCSDLSDRWKVKRSYKRRIDFSIDGDIVSWECPYIFLFGGYDLEDVLSEEIYSGVLRRLTFAPLF